jgi:carbonic anhydrase/acetyltransferase-like protein (isoleucine patch superfamily)
MIAGFKGKQPDIHETVFIAPNAVIIGDVEIKEGASIWFGAVLRGDMAPIVVGRNSSIQDNVTIHNDVDRPVIIGDRVTVGHNAVVHGCTIDGDCLVGIGAVLLNRAHIKQGSIIAAGSVVREGEVVGPCHLVAGIPALFKRVLGERAARKIRGSAEEYIRLRDAYLSEDVNNG